MEDCAPGQRKIVICSEPAESGAMISVVDLGKGIDKAIRNRIFDPFFTTKPAGMGMGLDVCLSIVEAHSGKLWFSDRPEGGTIFSFTLTAATEVSP
jgi:two-component system sensor histidine kinase DctS